MMIENMKKNFVADGNEQTMNKIRNQCSAIKWKVIKLYECKNAIENIAELLAVQNIIDSALSKDDSWQKKMNMEVNCSSVSHFGFQIRQEINQSTRA